ncbi:hypothetical protein [Natronomonas sp. EA1]|uniref:hypothetical protein n=1 Tax=Natronomonas sp. EA1 TaxID=3421655 RepID=UPI003EB7BF51
MDVEGINGYGVSRHDVETTLAAARNAHSAGEYRQALSLLEKARRWMTHLRPMSPDQLTHYAYQSLDDAIAAARSAVESPDIGPEGRVGRAIFQSQTLAQQLA